MTGTLVKQYDTYVLTHSASCLRCMPRNGFDGMLFLTNSSACLLMGSDQTRNRCIGLRIALEGTSTGAPMNATTGNTLGGNLQWKLSWQITVAIFAVMATRKYRQDSDNMSAN